LTQLDMGQTGWLTGLLRPATCFISSKTMMQSVGFKFD
jgi:hypothetical protein